MVRLYVVKIFSFPVQRNRKFFLKKVRQTTYMGGSPVKGDVKECLSAVPNSTLVGEFGKKGAFGSISTKGE